MACPFYLTQLLVIWTRQILSISIKIKAYCISVSLEPCQYIFVEIWVLGVIFFQERCSMFIGEYKGEILCNSFHTKTVQIYMQFFFILLLIVETGSCPGWPWTHNLPASTSEVLRITGVNNQVQVKNSRHVKDWKCISGMFGWFYNEFFHFL
jgi:hypothetical protein